jgi:hypothetical protein
MPAESIANGGHQVNGKSGLYKRIQTRRYRGGFERNRDRSQHYTGKGSRKNIKGSRYRQTFARMPCTSPVYIL